MGIESNLTSQTTRLDFTFQYPPFNVLNRREVAWTEQEESEQSSRPMHVYVHIPYCRSKCQFCFYKVWGVGTGEKAAEHTSPYLDVLFQEIDLYSQSAKVRRRAVRSVYIGGGTPSLLSPEQIESLVAKLRRSFNILPDCEFSLEAYPDEEVLTFEKLDCLKRVGINRLSIGVQSLNDRIQELNGRPARAEQFFRLYSYARSLGFRSINLDFMSGMVGETLQTWQSQIDALLKLAPENISLYKLEFYLNSRLTSAIRHGHRKSALVMSDSEEAELAVYAFDRLQNEGGYIASNSTSLARSRELEQVHTKSVWRGEDLLAVGLSAYGIFDGYMYQNTANLEQYLGLVTKGELPVLRAHRITEREKIARTMVNGVKVLRLSRKEFLDRHGVDLEAMYGASIRELVEEGLLEIDRDELRVPRAKYVFADDICRHFFLPEHRTMMTSQVLRSSIVHDAVEHAASSSP